MNNFLKIRNKLNIIAVLIFFSVIFYACENRNTEPVNNTTFPVEVETLKRTTRIKQLEYFGIISSQIVNYSFVVPGKIEQIFVRKNQRVAKGTKLVQLETTGLKLALNAAEQQFEQAQSAYEEANRYYANLKKAFESGGISETDLDKARLDGDVKEKDSQQAKINQQAKQDDLNHATLIALSDGIVSDIIPKTGEIIEAGAETVIVQGTGVFTETAIAQKDMGKVSVGSNAVVRYQNQKIGGSISYISSLPDIQTFRHTIKIVFSDDSLKKPPVVGQTVKIFIDSEKQTGIWISINHVYNDGESYVNVVENNRLRKKYINIIDFSGDKVRVSGLTENEMLITKGAANIKEGYRVKVTN